eukprot:4711476-Prymnesium_polylepis.1
MGGSDEDSSDDDSDDDSDSDDGSEGDGGEGEGAKGGEARAGRPVRVESALLVELESSKLEAMRAAVEVACALMAVDSVIVDSR